MLVGYARPTTSHRPLRHGLLSKYQLVQVPQLVIDCFAHDLLVPSFDITKKRQIYYHIQVKVNFSRQQNILFTFLKTVTLEQIINFLIIFFFLLNSVVFYHRDFPYIFVNYLLLSYYGKFCSWIFLSQQDIYHFQVISRYDSCWYY